MCYYFVMKKIEYSNLKPKESEEFHKFFSMMVNKFFYPEYTKNTLKFFCESEKEFPVKNIREFAKTGNILVAKDGFKYVGSLIFNEPDGGVTFCRWIAVDDKYQNNGIASKLIDIYEDAAKNKGAHCIMLCTEEENLDFYKKRGFQHMGVNPVGYYGVLDYWFYKQIQEPKEENYLR